jgi:hypothetical protein
MWLSNRVQIGYCSRQMGPAVSYSFQTTRAPVLLYLYLSTSMTFFGVEGGGGQRALLLPGYIHLPTYLSTRTRIWKSHQSTSTLSSASVCPIHPHDSKHASSWCTGVWIGLSCPASVHMLFTPLSFCQSVIYRWFCSLLLPHLHPFGIPGPRALPAAAAAAALAPAAEAAAFQMACKLNMTLNQSVSAPTHVLVGAPTKTCVGAETHIFQQGQRTTVDSNETHMFQQGQRTTVDSNETHMFQ